MPCRAGLEHPQGPHHPVGTIDNAFLGRQERVQRWHQLITRQLKAELQNPHQLHERDEGNEARLVGAQGFDQLVGVGRLISVVLHDEANQLVAVQADHRADAPRTAIALFMASIGTALLGRLNNPFRSVPAVLRPRFRTDLARSAGTQPFRQP
jgi:hypothetical protein